MRGAGIHETVLSVAWHPNGDGVKRGRRRIARPCPHRNGVETGRNRTGVDQTHLHRQKRVLLPWRHQQADFLRCRVADLHVPYIR